MTDLAKPAPVARVGRYEMGAEIASGGMATVYLARMQGAAGFEKFVALKRIHPHLASETAFVEMFLDEAQIASRIEHPNVCQVFDFGEADGAYFIAMEFLVGETLAKFQRTVARSELLHDPRRAFVSARLIADACEGLHAAHELRGRDGEYLNVVHRDISPQNLFVAFDGNTKVVDFGIASASDRLHQTMDGTVKGKFAYMAPEQARGKKVDRRADVFSLGVVLWELLAFQRLFRRDTPAETLVALMGEPIAPPSTLSPLSPPELDQVVLKALARDPDERYPNARELGRDLVRTLGRIGDAVDRAEVAEWLQVLFPDGRKRHEILLENARWGHAERTERSDAGLVSEVVSRPSSWSGVRGEELVDPTDVEDVIDDRAPAAPHPGPIRTRDSTGSLPGADSMLTPSPVAHAPVARPSPIRWVALGLVGLLVAVGAVAGLVVAFGLGDDPDPSPIAAAQTTQVVTPEGAGSGTEGSGTEGSGTGAAGTGAAGTEAAGTGAAGTEAAGTEAAGTEAAGTEAAGTESAGSDTGEDDAEADDEAADRHSAPRRGRRIRRHPPASSAATGAGTVIVSTPGGWANVYDQNGRFLGDTPLTISLPEGRHRLSLRPFGQPPSRNATVDVHAGQTARVNQPL